MTTRICTEALTEFSKHISIGKSNLTQSKNFRKLAMASTNWYTDWVRSEGGQDMAPSVPRHDTQLTACSQPGSSAGSLGLGCAHCVPNPVLTQCTVYSHCLEQWTLFMAFSKIKKNKIFVAYNLKYEKKFGR